MDVGDVGCQMKIVKCNLFDEEFASGFAATFCTSSSFSLPASFTSL